MKIIYLANVRIPTEKAHGLQIMKMGEAFKRQGLDIELVAAKRANNQLDQEDPFIYYGIKDKFPLKKIWLLDLVEISHLLKGFGIFLQNLSFAVSAFIYLIGKKADIIYSRDEFPLFLLCLFKNNLAIELHTFPRSKFGCYKFLFKRVKKIVAITHSIKDLLVDKLEVEENKIIVCPDGVDLAEFEINKTKEECRNDLGLPRDKNIILYSGHLFAWKGVYVLAESSRLLSGRELIVFVGGMDYDRQKLFVFINKNNLKNILLIPHQPPTKIPYYLKAADILVLPNSAREKISTHYTSPMKLFEYMAAQRPIVASDLPSLREILNENNAVLVPPDNPIKLAETIKNILQDYDYYVNICKQAFADSGKYTWNKRAERILNFINK